MRTQIRAPYSLIKRRYNKIGKKNVRLTQSSLVLMQAIVATTTTYTFPVLTTETNPTPFPEEVRLNQNDEFISYEIGYYLSGDMTIFEGVPPVVVSTGKFISTYAPVELSSTFLRIKNYASGTLKILVNNISRLEKWDLRRHEKVQRTQFQNSTVGQPFATLPSISFEDDGMFGMQPMLTLSGGKKNELTITLNRALQVGATGLWSGPDGVAMTVTLNQLMLMFRGLLAQNATKFQ